MSVPVDAGLLVEEAKANVGVPEAVLVTGFSDEKRVLVLTGESDAQAASFHDHLRVGARLRLFGAMPIRPAATDEARREAVAAEFWRQLLGLVYRDGQEPPGPGQDDPAGRDWLNLRRPDGSARRS